MLVIATQSMAGNHGSVAADGAIECSEAQGQRLIDAGLARLPDAEDGEPTPRQKRTALRWPDDSVPLEEPVQDELAPPPTVVEQAPAKKSRRRTGNAATNTDGDSPV